MKKLIKFNVIFITIILVLSFCFSIKTYAVNASNDNFDSVTKEASSWISKGENQFISSNIDTSTITGKIKPIAQALTTIGVGIILCITAYMGIKWLTAKPDEQAKLKQQTVGLLVAAIVVIGASTIWAIALRIVSKL